MFQTLPVGRFPALPLTWNGVTAGVQYTPVPSIKYLSLPAPRPPPVNYSTMLPMLLYKASRAIIQVIVPNLSIVQFPKQRTLTPFPPRNEASSRVLSVLGRSGKVVEVVRRGLSLPCSPCPTGSGPAAAPGRLGPDGPYVGRGRQRLPVQRPVLLPFASPFLMPSPITPQ